ncbi:MAG: divalent metal cation transporter [Clostridium sp.]|nr:divalent metal cation transporter [Clostridium sp.]
MNFTSRNLLNSLLAFIGLAISFTLLFKSKMVGIIIGLFLSLCIFFDPKKYESSKRKYEEKQNAKNDKNNLNI